MTTHAFTGFTRLVEPEWIDYNGHMNEAYYGFVLVEANEAFLDFVNLGEGYLATTGHAMYTVESHLFFLKECREGEALRAFSDVTQVTGKSLRVATTLRDTTGQDVLRAENIYLHMGEAGVTPLPAEHLAFLQRAAVPPTPEPG